MNISGFEKLRASLNEDMVKTVDMKELRKLDGSGRLGRKVVSRISNMLEGQGIIHYPKELPKNQSAQVRIYAGGTPVAEIMKAALSVGPENDQVLRERAGSEPERTLRKIRMLVCD